MNYFNQSNSIIQDLSIILVANNNLDLRKTIAHKILVEKNIVDSQWKLARLPVQTDTMTYICFENGINFVAKSGSLTILESINNKKIQNLKIASIVCKYLNEFSKLNYQGISINPNTFLVFDSSELKVARDYIFSNIFSTNIYDQLKTYLIRGSINFDYVFNLDQVPNNRMLKLNISETKLQLSGDTLQAAVSFSGYFSYQILGNTFEEKQLYITQIINNWQKDLEDYLEIVNKNFLNINEN